MRTVILLTLIALAINRSYQYPQDIDYKIVYHEGSPEVIPNAYQGNQYFSAPETTIPVYIHLEPLPKLKPTVSEHVPQDLTSFYDTDSFTTVTYPTLQYFEPTKYQTKTSASSEYATPERISQQSTNSDIDSYQTKTALDLERVSHQSTRDDTVSQQTKTSTAPENISQESTRSHTDSYQTKTSLIPELISLQSTISDTVSHQSQTSLAPERVSQQYSGNDLDSYETKASLVPERVSHQSTRSDTVSHQSETSFSSEPVSQQSTGSVIDSYQTKTSLAPEVVSNQSTRSDTVPRQSKSREPVSYQPTRSHTISRQTKVPVSPEHTYHQSTSDTLSYKTKTSVVPERVLHQASRGSSISRQTKTSVDSEHVPRQSTRGDTAQPIRNSRIRGTARFSMTSQPLEQNFVHIRKEPLQHEDTIQRRQRPTTTTYHPTESAVTATERNSRRRPQKITNYYTEGITTTTERNIRYEPQQPNSILEDTKISDYDNSVKSIQSTTKIQNQAAKERSGRRHREGGAYIVRYSNENNLYNGYKFGYETSNGIQRNEELVFEDSENVDHPTIHGGYEFTDPSGVKVVVTYTAGVNGFRPIIKYIE